MSTDGDSGGGVGIEGDATPPMPPTPAPRRHFGAINPPTFKWSSSNKQVEWRRFKLVSENIFKTAYKEMDDGTKVGYIINWMGPEGAELVSTWDLDDDEEVNLELHFKKFEEVFTPSTNFRHKRFEFRSLHQLPDENIETFVARLRLAVKECQYDDSDQHVIDAMIFGTNVSRIRQKLLEVTETKLTLDDALKQAKAVESAQKQLSGISGAAAAKIDAVKFKKKRFKHKEDKDCAYCGRKHKKGQCPAYGKTCFNCNNKNHFSSMCKKKTDKPGEKKNVNKKVHLVSQQEVSSESDDSEEYNLYFSNVNINHENVNDSDRTEIIVKLPVSTKFARKSVRFKVDTGAEGNLMPLSMYKQLHPNVVCDEYGIPTNLVEDKHYRLGTYLHTPIKQLGYCDDVRILFKGKCITSKFFIVDEYECILGLPTSEALGLITVNCCGVNVKDHSIVKK